MALVITVGNGEEFYLGPVDGLGGLVVIAPAHRAGDLGSNPGPGENFSLKLLIYQSIDYYNNFRGFFVCIITFLKLIFGYAFRRLN